MIFINAITTLCKYMMMIIMVVYTCNSFIALLRKNSISMSGREKFYSSQRIMTFFMFGTGIIPIIMNDFSVKTVILIAVELSFLIIYPRFLTHLYPKAKSPIICDMMMFITIGFIMLYRLSPDKCLRQMIIMIGVSIVTCWIPKFIEKLKNAKVPAAISGVIGLILLVLVLVLGSTSFGANLSLTIGGISIQPSEIVKITFVLLVAMLLRNRNDFKRVCVTSAIAAVHVLILVLSKDLGAALIYFLAYICMLYVATRNPLLPIAGLLMGAIASVGAYYLFAHVRVRVDMWLNPWSDPTDKGYQIVQSLFGIGSGGLAGTGLYRGRPTDVPLVIKDSIFAAISEEMGVIFGICLIFSILACLLRMIFISSNVRTLFYRLTGIGFCVLYGTQVVLTIGGTIKFIPLTGVTLPLISYGGSSLLSIFIIYLVMIGLIVMRQNEDDQIEKRQREIYNSRQVERGRTEHVVNI